MKISWTGRRNEGRVLKLQKGRAGIRIVSISEKEYQKQRLAEKQRLKIFEWGRSRT